MFRFILALSLIHSVVGQCNQNDRLIGDLCYSVSTQKVSAENAGSLCLLYNQYLAVIHTTLQANFLASIVRSQTGADKFWIGLRRASLNSRFQWSDGTTMTWSNFDSSLPKNDYYVAESTTNGKWQTINGGQQLYYVCSYTPGSVTGIPVSYPPSETPAVSYPASGAPVSYPASGAPVSYPPTGVPASEGPVSYPPSGAPVSYQPTGEPVSYPASGAPVSYPASEMPVSYPPSGAPVSYPASGAPVSYPPTGAPVSYPASGAPVSYPASGAPVSYPASGAPVSYPAYTPDNYPSYAPTVM